MGKKRKISREIEGEEVGRRERQDDNERRGRSAGGFLRAVRLLLACAVGVTGLMAMWPLLMSRIVPEIWAMIGIGAIVIWTVVILLTALRHQERMRTAWILIVLSLILTAGQLFVFNFSNSAAGFLNYIDRSAESSDATTPVDQATEQPFVLYVTGRDASGVLSDVNQLIVVHPKFHRILLVNTPRDFYVQLAGTTGLRDKLTHAGSYGLDTSIGTMEKLYGVDVNYYLQIRFDSLVKLVDTLGGIDVDSAYAFDEFEVGMNHLNGEQALKFARNRNAFAGGDRVRGENQQRIMTGILRKLSNPSVAMNLPSILSAMEGSFTTDLGAENVADFAQKQIAENPNWSITGVAMDGTGAMLPTYSYPNQNLYVMIPDQKTVTAAKKAINELLELK